MTSTTYFSWCKGKTASIIRKHCRSADYFWGVSSLPFTGYKPKWRHSPWHNFLFQKKICAMGEKNHRAYFLRKAGINSLRRKTVSIWRFSGVESNYRFVSLERCIRCVFWPKQISHGSIFWSAGYSYCSWSKQKTIQHYQPKHKGFYKNNLLQEQNTS